MPLETQSTRLAVPVTEADHAQGPADAPVTLIEYGDYECPYCGRVDPIVKRIQKAMGPRLRFVFRNFPQNSVHPQASVAAQAAEAAAAQGKFWEMHDMLYAHQSDLTDADFVQYALRLGMEVYRFEADLSAETYSRRVREDFQGGLRSGVKGTPTLFINSIRYDGEHEYEALRQALEAAEMNAR